MGQPDTTGAATYGVPRWLCYVEAQVSGNQGHSWGSRQPTMEQARTEAAEMFGVAPIEVKVEPYRSALPTSDADWINPV